MAGLILQQLVNTATIGAIYALIALGYTMVYGVLRLINFVHSELFMLGAYFCYGLLAFGLRRDRRLPARWLITVAFFAVFALVGFARGDDRARRLQAAAHGDAAGADAERARACRCSSSRRCRCLPARSRSVSPASFRPPGSSWRAP